MTSPCGRSRGPASRNSRNASACWRRRIRSSRSSTRCGARMSKQGRRRASRNLWLGFRKGARARYESAARFLAEEIERRLHVHRGTVRTSGAKGLHNRSFLQSVRSVSQRVRIANVKGIEGRCSEAARTRLTQEFEKRFPGQAGVADQCSQETPPKLPVSRYREPPAGRPDQDHVTAFHAIERESDPGDRRDELVSRNDRKSRHRYTRTSTT